MAKGVQNPKKIRLIPYICGAGASLSGCEEGPSALKKSGLQKDLASAGHAVSWIEDPGPVYQREKEFYENLPPLGSVERKNIVLRNCRQIADLTEQCVREGAFPVTIGGDHSLSAGSIAGFARAKNAHGRIGLIWVDAHADLNTGDTSPSQALHGMPVAFLLGLGDPDFATIGGPQPVLKPENIIYIGLRDIDEGEESRIRGMGLQHFSVNAMRTYSGVRALYRAIARMEKNTDHLVMSIDTDVFDPSTAPAVGTPVIHGFDRQSLLSLMTQLVKRHRPSMIEAVEFNPHLPGAAQTYEIVRDVLKAALS